MLLLRLSGHSGAGKSRLTAALSKRGMSCPRAVLFTSRAIRDGEVEGRDYNFRSKETIDALPRDRYYVGPVRDMLQAVDLDWLQNSLETNDFVLIEIFADLWPGLEVRLRERLGDTLRTTSVFMTALDPLALSAMSRGEAETLIEKEVREILRERAKDPPDKIPGRAKSAVGEILGAIDPTATDRYDRIIHSAPEGPDGKDEWTSGDKPTGRAATALDEFIGFANGGRR